MPEPLLSNLTQSWELALLSANRSPKTITSYLRGARLYLEWCGDNEHPEQLTRPLVQRYMGELIADGKAANTVALRLAALKQFTRWLAEEEEIPEDPLVGLRAPKIPTKVTPALSDDQLSALLTACRGNGFRDRRDTAIVRLMLETGIRASETVALTVADVEPLRGGVVTIRSGKGGKGRTAPFGPQVGTALDRYLRIRATHNLAATPALWLGVGGNRGLSYHGLNDTLRDRAKAAGIPGFHLHLMRHTAATRWLRAGGSEQGLMSVAGWTSRSMLDRYTGASASERAAAEARGLNLGEL
ncbi:tyrosine-type recombinase/integrase [Mycobacterium sp. P7213]|uniref:tyrosine-type recombinase/integrase n=1 Tax=Mycobacterium sp. P7213 TaxID=2478465 RepID=UPI001F1520E4|nr:tyrosine-type recombinase/integrase [Mycobacterium sp. P7213]